MRASALGFKRVMVRYEMFNYEFECIIGPAKNVPKYVANRFEDVANEGSWSVEGFRGMYLSHKDFVPIVWLPEFPRTTVQMGTLAHEVAHAVTHMLNHVGVQIRSDNDETFCHAIGHGVTKILEAKRGR